MKLTEYEIKALRQVNGSSERAYLIQSDLGYLEKYRDEYCKLSSENDKLKQLLKTLVTFQYYDGEFLDAAAEAEKICTQPIGR